MPPRTETSTRPPARSPWLAALSLVPVLLTAGCLHLEQDIVWHADGRATVVTRYSVAEESLELLATGQRVIQGWQADRAPASAPALNWFFSRASADEFFQGKGIRLERHRVETRDGRRHVEVRVVAEDARRAFASGRFGDFALVTDAAGDQSLTARLVATPETAALTPEARVRLRELCRGLRLVLSVTVPGQILSTTAHRQDGQRATWVFDADADASFLERTPEIAITFRAGPSE